MRKILAAALFAGAALSTPASANCVVDYLVSAHGPRPRYVEVSSGGDVYVYPPDVVGNVTDFASRTRGFVECST